MVYNKHKRITSGTLENYPFFECSLSTLKVSKDIQSRYTFVTGNEDLLKYMKEGNKTLINTLKELGLYESYSTEANRFSYKRLKASTAYTNMNIDSQNRYNEELEGKLWP